MNFLYLSVGWKRPDKVQCKGHTDSGSEKVGTGLGENDSVDAEESREQEYQRNETDAVAQTGKHCGRTALADALIEHIGTLHEHADGHGHALRLQCGCADGYDLRIVAELPDDEIRRKDEN